MSYDFSTVPQRRGSGSYKWDSDLPDGVVLTPEQRERVIPLWVADMDFPAAPFILDVLRRRLEHGVFGYTKVQDRYYEGLSDLVRTEQEQKMGTQIDFKL